MPLTLLSYKKNYFKKMTKKNLAQLVKKVKRQILEYRFLRQYRKADELQAKLKLLRAKR